VDAEHIDRHTTFHSLSGHLLTTLYKLVHGSGMFYVFVFASCKLLLELIFVSSGALQETGVNKGVLV